MATSFPPLPNRGFASTDPNIAAVDASLRGPVIACFLTAVHWLVLGTFLLVYASSLMHPQNGFPFLDIFNQLSANCSFFTYGRVWPAAIDALVYGWASTAGLGLAIWLMARICGTVVRGIPALMTAIIFWNIGIAVGLSAIFLGHGTSIELLEFPVFASTIMWFAYALFAIWAVLAYLSRPAGPDHIVHAWLLAALFAFPALFAAGAILLGGQPLPGASVIQFMIDAWYVHGFYTLWIAPIGLATLYYLIPKISGINLKFASKAKLAFWSWIVLAPWTASHDFVGGPFPAETVVIGLILSGLIFIPVALIGFSLVPAAFEGEGKIEHGVVFPFLSLGACFFVAAGATEQLLSIRGAADLLRFTMFREANQLLWLYGFFSFTVFGAIYYILPRLLDFGWRSAFLIKMHYYASLYGTLLIIAILGFGGIAQGMLMESADKQITMPTITQLELSFYIATTMCISMISIGNGIFAFHLGWMLRDWLRLRIRASALASEILAEPYDGAPVSNEEVGV